MEKRIYYLSNTVISNTKREKNIQVFNVFTQVGVKQLTDFLRTVTAASDLVDCTLVNCVTSHFVVSVATQAGFRLTWSETMETYFLSMKLSVRKYISANHHNS